MTERRPAVSRVAAAELPALLGRTRHRLAITGGAAVRRIRGGDGHQLSDREVRRLRDDISVAVSPTTSEMTARDHAAAIGNRYLELDDVGRHQFFSLLASDFDVDRSAVNGAVSERQRAVTADDLNEGALIEAEEKLRRALISPRVRLMTRFNGIEHGVKFLVDLRADLRDVKSDDVRFRAMDGELRTLLGSWFDLGLLELRQISWETPAALLERLIAYESVHAIQSWTDLKNRLDSDRRCYAFFHPGMPDEPLIFVEVALVKGIADNVVDLLDESQPTDDASTADTAIFYSISNCQRGLAGVNLGDSLIKRVVGDLIRDLPNLTTFATLSPIPGFRAWLDEQLGQAGTIVLTDQDRATLAAVAPHDTPEASIAMLLADDDWPDQPEAEQALRAPLTRACARYLLQERRGTQAADRVANFHLTNGARVEQLNWLGNQTAIGLHRSAGIMVNYRYLPDDIEKNHHRYVAEGEVVASSAIRKLLDT